MGSTVGESSALKLAKVSSGCSEEADPSCSTPSACDTQPFRLLVTLMPHYRVAQRGTAALHLCHFPCGCFVDRHGSVIICCTAVPLLSSPGLVSLVYLLYLQEGPAKLCSDSGPSLHMETRLYDSMRSPELYIRHTGKGIAQIPDKVTVQLPRAG